MTATWPSANPCIKWTSWAAKYSRDLFFSSWLAGLLVITSPLSLGLNLKFCDSNVIDHFLCDSSFLKISCSDTWFVEQMVLICAVLTLILTLMCVVLPYTYITKTILGFPSAQQRKKAFSTCSSHMMVFSIKYGTYMFIYMKPTTKEEVTINKVVSLLISSISPMLNPLIYTLRNKQIKKSCYDPIKIIASLLK